MSDHHHHFTLDDLPRGGERLELARFSKLNGALLGCEPLGGLTEARDAFGVPIWSGGWQDCIDSLPRSDRMNPRPDVAMLMFGGVAYDARIDGRWRSPCDPEYERLYAQRVGAAVDTLSAGRTPVVLVKPAPVVAQATEDLHGVTDNRRRFISALRYGMRVETPTEFLAGMKKK